MDFEVLSENPRSLTLFEEWERLLTNRKLALQRWMKTPPYRLAWSIFFLVVVELVVGARLMGGSGFNTTFVRQFASVGAVILAAELLLAIVAAQAAELFKTTGDTFSLLSFFHLGLTPLLLMLPITTLTWTSQAGQGVRFFLFVLLLVRVVGHWRDALERVYKLSKMQSALVMYGASSLVFVLLLLAGYAILFNKLSSLLL